MTAAGSVPDGGASDYLRLASWRVFRSGHAHKSIARTNRDRQGVLL